MNGKHLKTIQEDNTEFKYNVAFPLHAASEAGDVKWIKLLAKQRDVNSYNERGQKPLHVASVHKHIDAVEVLLSLGADVNASDKFVGRTSLHYACRNGDTELANVLLCSGALVYEQDKNGAYPMHLAAEGGQCSIVKQLALVGASVTCKDRNNADPIHYAAKFDKHDTILTLFNLGANLESVDMENATPMHYAAAHGSCLTIRKLFALGASLDSKDKHGESPIFLATRTLRTESIITLAELGGDMNLRNTAKECAIHVATSNSLLDSLRQLIRSGSPVDTTFKKGMQPTHIAALQGLCDVIKVLHQEKADMNATSKNGDRPLHFAVKGEQMAAIQCLVALGAVVNCTGKKGQTPIHLATKKRMTKIVRVLASVGANCNLEDELCVFPFYYAALNEDEQTGKQLLKCGADVNKVNSEGLSMLHIMVEEEKLVGLTTMKAFNTNFGILDEAGNSVVHCASSECQLNVLQHLKHLDVDLSITNKDGLSALHVAVINDRGNEIDMLINVGVDLNCRTLACNKDEIINSSQKSPWPHEDIPINDFWKTRTGMSSIHLSLLYDRRHILTQLVKCGANINQSDDAGETVFHISVLFKLADWYKLLLSLGADRNCKDIRGRTPLHYAAHTGSLECLRYLLKAGAVITCTDNVGRYPLHYAAEAGHYLLLSEFTAHSNSVNVDCQDLDGLTPLHLACQNGQLDTILELLQLKADITVADKNGNTVVHQAAGNGQNEVIVLLASLGCNMDIQNQDLSTPLHVAGEAGKGETMEYLLMCGCNPNIRNKNEVLPNTFKLPSKLKLSVINRMNQLNRFRSSLLGKGEIGFDCRMLLNGQTVDLNKLGITITMTSTVADTKPIIFIHRTPADFEHLEIPVKGIEEILSDVYEIRCLCVRAECTLQLEIPIDGYPGKFESFLRTTNQEEFSELTISEANGVPKFIGKITFKNDGAKKFIVLARPKVYQQQVGHDGGTLIFEVDRRIRLEIPKGAFTDNVNVNLQVLKTTHIDQTFDRTFATDVITLNAQQQPSRNLLVQIPLLDSSADDSSDLAVFAIRTDQDIDDENNWITLQSPIKIQNNCIAFAVEHFSHFVPVYIKKAQLFSIDNVKRNAKEKIQKALKRETTVLFFYAVCKKAASYLTVLECTTPSRFPRRKEFWKSEGFVFHPQVKHSGHFVAKPNQKFFFQLSGNLDIVGTSVRLQLTFNPRCYKYQSFYLKSKDARQPFFGEIQVKTDAVLDPPEQRNGYSFITNIPVEIPEVKVCSLS